MAVTGTRVLAGRYALGEVLGTGGTATVWRARDEVLGREVAVKVLSPQYAADPGFLARFEREARHAARLSHPHLVTVFDCGVDGTLPFIVMELVAGRTLRQVLDQAGMLPAGEAVRPAAAARPWRWRTRPGWCTATSSPPTSCWPPPATSRSWTSASPGPRAGAAAPGPRGCWAPPPTCPPEQASGRPAGPQADLYALVCVLFEMLTCAPPFSADSAVGLAYRHVHDDPGPPSARRPGLSPQLDQITARLLAKDPAGRPASAAAARAGLLSALNPDATTVLNPAGEPEPGLPVRRRWQPRLSEAVLAVALAAALACLAAVLLTGTAGQSGSAAAAATHPAVTPTAHKPPSARRKTPPGARHHKPRNPAVTPQHASALPPAAAAAAAFVGDLQAAVADGQVAPQAGQDLFSHLQQLLFGPPGQNAQQIQQQYQQLLQSYDQHRSQGDITGAAAARLRHALDALGPAVGAS